MEGVAHTNGIRPDFEEFSCLPGSFSDLNHLRTAGSSPWQDSDHATTGVTAFESIPIRSRVLSPLEPRVSSQAIPDGDFDVMALVEGVDLNWEDMESEFLTPKKVLTPEQLKVCPSSRREHKTANTRTISHPWPILCIFGRHVRGASWTKYRKLMSIVDSRRLVTGILYSTNNRLNVSKCRTRRT